MTRPHEGDTIRVVKHPLDLNQRQKTLAALLALGVPTEEAAKQLGVSRGYVEVLLKGGLFTYEIDRAREALIGERLGEYNKLVSEQLLPNLRTLIDMRDNDKLPASSRLRAIELITEAVVPKAMKKGAETTAKVKIEFSPEKRQQINEVVSEAHSLDTD